MKRRKFFKTTAVAALGAAATPKIFAGYRFSEKENRSILNRIISKNIPSRWEDYMLSGNGATGIMVHGAPFNESIVVNHEKFWTIGNDFRPQTPDMAGAWVEAKKIAMQGRYLDADMYIVEKAKEKYREMYGEDFTAHRPAYDRAHPGFHFLLTQESNGQPEGYSREINLETGEVSVYWTDNRGDWKRNVFVSRTEDIIVLEIIPPPGFQVNAKLSFIEAPGKLEGDIKSIETDHLDDEIYLHATYGRKMGMKNPQGYHSLAKIITGGGRSRSVAGERTEVNEADKLLVIAKVEYLDDDTKAERSKLKNQLDDLPCDYRSLLKPHADIHGEMYNRVSLDLGGLPGDLPSSENLISDALNGNSLNQFFELMHAAGRYALICGGTGELAPALMGPWGNEWNPPWDGRYTFDANLNLAVAAVSQGNLPEVMDTYTNFLELNLNDWRKNARRMYGCKGALTDLCQGYRHGAVLMPTYPWTGGVGWLARYMYDHFLFTRDKNYLEKYAVPMLMEAAEFYMDFLTKYPEQDGKYVFYPSISPENSPVMVPQDQSTNVVPNSTSEISICKEVFTTLIEGCKILGIQQEKIPIWQNVIAKLPEYKINEDGALSEWSYPGLGDNYNHRHSSHLYAVYPGLEITPYKTPELHKAAKIAMEKRLEAGLGNNSAHGYMHISLVAARLKDPELMWKMLSTFANYRFLNTSFFTCHNPGPRIYNLDATFSMPAVLTEMLVYSESGVLEILPALPQDKFQRGCLRGLLARGGIIVEELNWNKILGTVNVQIKSVTDQQIVFRLGVDMRFIRAGKKEDADSVKPLGKGKAEVKLQKDKTLLINCRF